MNMTAGLPDLCLRRSAPLSLRTAIGRYVFPLLFAAGVIGNLLNLLVLNSKDMRSKTNALLSSMAVADLCFFFSMFPLQLQVFDAVADDDYYRLFVVRNKMTLTFLTNWFSNASTWLALMVTAERVVAIKMPLHAKFHWQHRRVVLAILVIFLVACLTHLYNLFWFQLRMRRQNCDGNRTILLYELRPVNASDSAYYYVQVSQVFVPHFAVTVPFFVLVVLNGFLLYYLHESRRAMAYLTRTAQMKDNEMRVVLTVAVIVLTFTLCSAPSVVVYLFDAICTYVIHQQCYTAAFYNWVAVSNCLVSVGKASNFLLYCSASRHFRRRLLRLLTPARARRARRASSQHRMATNSTFFSNPPTSDSSSHHRTPRGSRDIGIVLQKVGGFQDNNSQRVSADRVNLRRIENQSPVNNVLQTQSDRPKPDLIPLMDLPFVGVPTPGD